MKNLNKGGSLIHRQWSKDKLLLDFKNCWCLMDVILVLEKDCSKSNQVLCQVKVNDRNIEWEDNFIADQILFDDIQKLDVFTECVRDLHQETLKSCIELIPFIRESCSQSTFFLRQGEIDEAKKTLLSTIESCEYLTEAVFLLKGRAKPETWGLDEQQFTQSLTEVVTAFEVDDWVSVGDLLEDDVQMALDQWSVGLEELKNQV